MSAFAAVAAFLYPVWENIRERDGFGMKILVTAFEPFGGDAVNPTMEALSRLAPREGLFKLVLPVTFAGAGERVARAIEELRPDAYFTTLPVREIARRIGDMGIPAGLSLSAGAYVCNHVMYTCLHLARTKYPGMKCGFVHVPYTAEMPHDASKPSLPFADIVRAVEEAVRVIAGEDA